ncbi:hypothetical protein ANO11243_065610 [Dothideomycetidae sp. 11243]|nr:hypothetical protein ANO11243_065610 [fungal sp. No.11243]
MHAYGRCGAGGKRLGSGHGRQGSATGPARLTDIWVRAWVRPGFVVDGSTGGMRELRAPWGRAPSTAHRTQYQSGLAGLAGEGMERGQQHAPSACRCHALCYLRTKPSHQTLAANTAIRCWSTAVAAVSPPACPKQRKWSTSGIHSCSHDDVGPRHHLLSTSGVRSDQGVYRLCIPVRTQNKCWPKRGFGIHSTARTEQHEGGEAQDARGTRHEARGTRHKAPGPKAKKPGLDGKAVAVHSLSLGSCPFLRCRSPGVTASQSSRVSSGCNSPSACLRLYALIKMPSRVMQTA